MPTLDMDLSEAGQRELYEYLAAKFGAATPANDVFSAGETDLWDAMHEALGLAPTQTLASFAASVGKARYALAADNMHKLIERHCGLLRRPQRTAMRVELLRCLAVNLEARGLPCRPKTMFSNLDMLMHAVDQAYPGYVAAGMLKRIVA